MTVRSNKAVLGKVARGCCVGSLVLVAIPLGFVFIFRPFVLGDFSPLFYMVAAVQAALSLRYLLRSDPWAAAAIWLSWPVVVFIIMAFALWIVPAYKNARSFIVDFDIYYARKIAEPTQPVTALILNLRRTTCDAPCAEGLFADLGIEMLGINNITYPGPNRQINITSSGVTVCDHVRPTENSPEEAPGCDFRTLWRQVMPRIEIDYFAPHNTSERVEKSRAMSAHEFSDEHPTGRRLAYWRVGKYQHERFGPPRGRPFTLDDALTQLFGRKVSAEETE